MTIAVLGAACALVLLKCLPRDDAPAPTPSVARGSGVGRVMALCGAVALLATAHISAFTYISLDAPAAGIPASRLPLLLLMMGVAGAAGTVVIGRIHDAHPAATTLAAGLATVGGLAATGASGWRFAIGALVWSTAYTALTAVLPATVVNDAPGWAERASAWYVLAFQIGIAAGAELGGHRMGLPGPLIAAAVALLGVGCLGARHAAVSRG